MTYTMAIALQKAVYAALSADAALQALVGTAIFDAPPVGAIPALYVSLGPETAQDRSDQGISGARHDFVISVVTDAGGFLDISLDFLFYSLIPFGFVLANPEQNAVAGSFLIFSFIGTGSSFLAFAIMAGKRGIDNPVYKHKSLYHMSGLTEGTETIGCFVLFCLFPQHFAVIAYIFGAACWFTTFTRIYSGFHTLKP